MAIRPKEVFKFLYAAPVGAAHTGDNIGEQFLNNLLKHLYDQSLCNVLVRCLVFNDTFFNFEEDSPKFEHDLYLKQAHRIRNELILALVEKSLV